MEENLTTVLKSMNLIGNPNINVTQEQGCFTIFEHISDLSCSEDPIHEYFRSQMNVRKRQVLAVLAGNTVKMQAGAMQWMFGNVETETGLGSGAGAVGGFFKGMVKGAVTGESAVKPLYKGSGLVMLEPTYKYLFLEDVSQWGPQGVVLEDGLFLACDAHLNEKVTSRKSISSLFAGEGIFNLNLSGNGIAVLESPVPRQELIEFNLNNSELKIDGNMAIMWSGSLAFTLEKSSKTWLGSLVNREGLVNVYRGTGKVLMAPTIPGTIMDGGDQKSVAKAEGGSTGKSTAASFLNSIVKTATDN